MRSSLEEFVAAGPWPLPAAIRILLPLARRPRGRAILGLVGGGDQALWGVAAMGHYDRPEVARELGWDPEQVVARGRALRLEEGRP